MERRRAGWALGLLWGCAAAGALTIMASLALGAKWMLAASTLAAALAICAGALIARQMRPRSRPTVHMPTRNSPHAG
jgi:hypothetical protein